ncbi:MAG TPA: SIMPL domain-containing protein [Acidobacteriaceae bacterium]|jgi:hypothetical protein|nr:SIMPL domain-containing protein [Acidobacteriaceae bacterium]
MMKQAWVVAAAILFCMPMLRAQTIQVDKNNRTIAVTAEDKASAPADMAAITVGFTAYGPDAATAYANGSRLSNAIMDAVKKAGVPDKEIESQQQNLSRTTFPYDDKSTPEDHAQKAFTLAQSWTVHAAAADAARILHAAVEAGANDSGNIQWDVADHNALQAKAAEKALQRARQIATQMAAGLGAQLGELIYASNQTAAPRPLVFKEAMVAGRAAPAPPPQPLAIRPQQVEEMATVYAVFAIQ